MLGRNVILQRNDLSPMTCGFCDDTEHAQRCFEIDADGLPRVPRRVDLFRLKLRSESVAAENLFSAQTVGLYVERKQKPRRASNAIRFRMVPYGRAIPGKPSLSG